MFKEELEKRIASIQNTNKELEEYKSLLDVCEPGETGFIPKKGFCLVVPVNVPTKVRSLMALKEKSKPLEDWMGLYPLMGVIMESSSDEYKAGDIVLMQRPEHENQRMYESVVVKAAVAQVVNAFYILGKDVNLKP